MLEKQAHLPKKYIFWIIISALAILSFIIIKPFIIALISSFILAYLTKPAFNYLSPKLGKSLSASICIVLVVLIIIFPLVIVIGSIINQASVSIKVETLQNIFKTLSSFPLLEKFNIDLQTITEKGISLSFAAVTKSVSYIPSLVLTLFVTLFGMYYILINWDSLAANLEGYIPFENKKRIRKEMAEITNTLIYGTLLIALIELIVAINGFLISGVGAYLVLSVLVFFFAFIPGVGPAAVWAPTAIYYLFTKSYLTATGVIITGLILSVFVDTLLRVKLLGSKTKINPLIMLVGILGGISLFGIFGFIIGPLILIYTIELIETTLRQNKE